MTGATKICNRCGIEKPVEEFYICKGYRHTPCKQCHAQCDRSRYTKRKNENMKLYGAAHTPEELKKGRERQAVASAEMRIKALALSGGKCECCGDDRPERLTLDHIDGGGRKSGVSGAYVVREILAMGNPASKYRVLCWNCNMSLGAHGYCPHQGRPPEEEPARRRREPMRYRRQLNRKYILETVAEYGGKCQVCDETRWEFLCIDHINGGGNQHRKELGKYGAAFCRWLKNQGYPKGEYQLLCHNCNGVKEIRKKKKIGERRTRR